MTVSSAIESELPFLRAEANARMTSTCNIWRQTGRSVQNESNGLEEPQWARAYTSLPCRVKGSSGGSSSWSPVDRNEVESQVATRVLNLPLGTVVRDEDWVEVTSGDSAGQVFRVLESANADQQTALRLPVIGDYRPTSWS